MNKYPEEWNELDAAAKCQLNHYDLDEFFKYKQELFIENNNWYDNADVLIGYIWNCIECYEDDE